nr:DUF3450 domain-containing protein [Planctomycetota bacterium]
MKAASRRFHFQLTPLLDLLLIVIFAQYLEVTQQAERQTIAAERQVVERQNELGRRYAQLEADLEQERESLRVERQNVADSDAANSAEVEELRRRLEDVAAQQRQAANLVAELFHIPQELIDEALKPLPIGTPPRSQKEVERLRQRFEELAVLRGPEVVEHLLSYDELRKRADVWRLRIERGGGIVFTPGESSQS